MMSNKDLYAPLPHKYIVGYSETEECKTFMENSLDRNGFVIVTGVLGGGVLDKAVSLTWDDLEYMSPNLNRNDPSTWVTANRPDDMGGMIQSMAGWTRSQMYVRRRTVKVFKRLYGTSAIDLSADGMSFSGLVSRRVRKPNQRVHVDAGYSNTDTNIVQGVVNLVSQNPGDACFGCYPGSHDHHRDMMTHEGNKNWHALSDFDRELLEASNLDFKRFPLQAGSMLLFRSQLAHSQAHPIADPLPQKHRIVHYVCGLPACDTPGKRKLTMIAKRKAYEENRATSHWPNEQYARVKLFPARLGNGIVGRYKRDITHLRKACRVDIDSMTNAERRYMGLESHIFN